MKPLILLYSLFSLFFFLDPSFARSEPASTPPAFAPGVALAPPENPSSACPTPPCGKNFHPPSFKVVFHNLSGQTHLLIPPNTPIHQIENLIYYLSEGLKNNEFEKIGIPANGSGDYTRGSILVFKVLKWAKGERLTNPRIKEKTYSRYVLAEYIWNSRSETAYIGQKNLFSRSLSSQK